MRAVLFLAILLALLSLGVSARADASASKAEARQHFKAGLARAAKGDFTGAVDAFERAYATSPHYGVLYNLGQAYAALGRSEQAVLTLERFLADGSDAIIPARHAEVRELIARERARLGRVELEITPAGAEAFLDGKSLGSGPFEGMELAAGLHVIGARMAGYDPRAQVVEIGAGTSTRLSLALEPIRSMPAFGFLRVRCALPNVGVSVDGVRRFSAPPNEPFLVPAGQRTVRFSRDGYVERARPVTIVVERVTELDCALTPDPKATSLGSLKISTNGEPASVTVDGDAYRGGPLPAGPHVVRVEHHGFYPWESLVSVQPHRARELFVVLKETEARIREREADRTRQKTWASAVGIGGLTLAAGAAGIYAWNSSRYDDWRRKTDRLDAELASGMASAGAATRAGELRNDVADIQRVNDLALSMAIGAGAALVVSGVLWVTSL